MKILKDVWVSLYPVERGIIFWFFVIGACLLNFFMR